MDNYNGTYKVVHQEWNQSLPEVFELFEDAYKAQQDWDKTASIVQMDADSENVVCDYTWEYFVSNSHF